MRSQGKHSKDPYMRECDVTRFMLVEIEAALSVLNVPSLSILPWKKSNCLLSKAKTKVKTQSFCFILKLSSFGAYVVCCGPQ